MRLPRAIEEFMLHLKEVADRTSDESARKALMGAREQIRLMDDELVRLKNESSRNS